MESFIKDIKHNYYGNIKVLKNEIAISQHLFNGYTIWEENILNDYLKKYIKNNSLFLDIGAHIGLHTLGLMRHCKDNKLNVEFISFEPQKEIYKMLKYNIENNNPNNYKTQIFNCGLSDENIIIYDNEEDYFKNTNCGGHNLILNKIRMNDKQIETEIFKLDNFNFNNISLIKIDVEGMEDKVLNGAIETIKRNKPIIILEIMGGINYLIANEEQKEKIHNTINILINIGYNWKHISQHDYFFFPTTL